MNKQRVNELVKGLDGDEAKALIDFVEFYGGFVKNGEFRYYLHPEDEKYLREKDYLVTWNQAEADDYTREAKKAWEANKNSKDAKDEYNNKLNDYFKDKIDNPTNRTKIVDNIAPYPFCGNILDAKVVTIFANPGFSAVTYNEEKALEAEQAFLFENFYSKSEYPFWPLNPEYQTTPGGKWWWSKKKQLSGLVEELANEVWHVSIDEARKRFARLFCNIETVPYHSKKIDSATLKELKAYKIHKNFIENYLYPKAKKGEICLLKIWGKNDVLVGDKFPEVGAYHVAPVVNKTRASERLSPIPTSSGNKAYEQNGKWIMEFLSASKEA